ncbi:hypothetical protein [Legionella moravica]|nr:hypothetical protein [Legionella moravica]
MMHINLMALWTGVGSHLILFTDNANYLEVLYHLLAIDPGVVGISSIT